jgi:hypothetical protein
MRQARRPSGSLPGRTLLLDEISRWTAERNPFPPCDSFEDFGGGRTRNLFLENLLNVIGKSLATGACATHQFAMQSLRDVSDLNHL